MVTYHGLWGFETEKSSEIGKSYGINAGLPRFPSQLPSWMVFCLRLDSMSPRSDQPRCSIMEYVNRCPFSLNISSLRPVVMHLRLATCLLELKCSPSRAMSCDVEGAAAA